MATVGSAKQKDIVSRITSYISEGIAHCDGKHNRCEQNQIYATTEQWSKGDILKQQLKDRPAVPWNSIFKVVQAIANREIVERFVPKVMGRSDSDNGIAEVIDEACKWQRQMSLSEHLESMAVRSTVIGGYGWIHKYWDPSKNNGDGQIVDEDVPVWEMLWPVRARQMNLSDRRWHVRGKWITVDEAKARWGDLSPTLGKMFKKIDQQISLAVSDTNTFPDTNTDPKLSPMSSAFGWGSVQDGSWMNIAERELFIVEAEWIEPTVTYKAAIPVRFSEWEGFVAGQSQITLNPEDEQSVLQYGQFVSLPFDQQQEIESQILFETKEVTIDSIKEVHEFSDRYEFVTKKEFVDYRKVIKDSVKYAVVTNNMVLDYGERPWGFSYYAITGFPVETRTGMDFVGAVDIVKGPQDYKNALLSNMLAMYMASPKRPMFIERGAVADIDDLANKIASPSAVVVVPDGFHAQQKFSFGDAPTFPTMATGLLDLASRGVEEAFGLSSIDQGTQQDLRRVSGNVVQAARAANNVIIAIIFDAIRMFRKQYGLCNLKFICEMYAPDEIIRIVGPEKIEDLSSVDLSTGWGDVHKYDILVEEQPSSPSELMELTDFLTRTGTLDNWIARGNISFEDALRLMPQIPESDKRAILKGKTSQEQLTQTQEQLAYMQQLIMEAAKVPEAAQVIQQSMQQHEIEKGLQPQPTQ